VWFTLCVLVGLLAGYLGSDVHSLKGVLLVALIGVVLFSFCEVRRWLRVARQRGEHDPDVTVEVLLASRSRAGVVVGAATLDLGPVACGWCVVDGHGQALGAGQRRPDGLDDGDGEVASIASGGADGGVGGAELVGNAAGPEPGGDGIGAAAGERPKHIDLTDKGGRVLRGIYALQGDTLKIALSAKGPEGPRPASFEDKDAAVVILKREKP
jgi:hypothetical protein